MVVERPGCAAMSAWRWDAGDEASVTCRYDAHESPGKQACPCVAVLRGAAPRSVSASGGTRVRSDVSMALRCW